MTGFTPEIISYYPSEAENYAKDNNFIFTSLGLILSDNGEVTDSVKWSINTATGVLMISGSGRVPGYLYFDETPWSVYRDYIKTVIYGSGIQNVGDSSFEGCTSLINVTLAGTVTEIGDWAFSGTGIVNLTLPRGIQTINDGAFVPAQSLQMCLCRTLFSLSVNLYFAVPISSKRCMFPRASVISVHIQ